MGVHGIEIKRQNGDNHRGWRGNWKGNSASFQLAMNKNISLALTLS